MKWLELNLLSLCKMQHGNLVLLLRVTYCLILLIAWIKSCPFYRKKKEYASYENSYILENVQN